MAEQRVAVVTGATRGIGRAIACGLAASGFDVAAIARPPVEGAIDRLEALAREIGRSGGVCRGFPLDIADTAAHASTVAAIRAAFGRVDVLVNNAGIAPPVRRDLLEMSAESFDAVLGVNLRGPLFFTQAMAATLIETAGLPPTVAPAVVFITSVSADLVSLNRVEYCISKAGLSMAARAYAARFAAAGIRVFEVRPGLVRTDMTAAVASAYDERIRAGLVPQGRWADPDDVARAVLALVSGQFDYSTGAIIDLSGGLTIPRL